MRPITSALFAFTVLASMTLAQAAFAAPDPAAYDQMVQAKAMVEIMKMPEPPAAIREALLKESRPEDLTFIKSMLVFWKKNSAQNISAEFNHIMLRDPSGNEVMEMIPVENSPGQFRINGRVWSVPEKGSISDSLRKHLVQKSESVSIFDLVSRAYARGDISWQLGDAVYYYMAVSKPTIGDLAAVHIKTFDTSKYFSIQDNIFQTIFEKLGGKRPTVTCGPEEATGRLVIGLEPMSFRVRKDGNVILTPFETKKSFLAKNDDDAHWRADVRYQACVDSDCTKTAGPEKSRIGSFLKVKSPEEVDVAFTFMPRDGDQKTYPVVFDCPDRKECDRMVINDREKLSAADRKVADRHVVAANAALAKLKADQSEAIQAIRPLFACCQSVKCQYEVLGSASGRRASPTTGRDTSF